MTKQARAPEAKAERRAAILGAAAGLFSTRGYDAITMADIAAEAGLAKGTVYLYFRTREELFHALLVEREIAGLERLDERFGEIAGELPDDIAGRGRRLAREMAAAFTCDELLLDLLRLSDNTLEANTSIEALTEHKTRLMAAVDRPARRLVALLGVGEAADGLHLFMLMWSLLVGLLRLAALPENAREAARRGGALHLLEEPGNGLGETLARGVGYLLQGFVAEQGNRG